MNIDKLMVLPLVYRNMEEKWLFDKISDKVIRVGGTHVRANEYASCDVDPHTDIGKLTSPVVLPES